MSAPSNRPKRVFRIKKRSVPPDRPTFTSKMQRSALDDAITALQLQHPLEFPTKQEKEHNVQAWDDKHRADDLGKDNAAQSPLLKLPQEVLDIILDMVFRHRIIQVSMVNGKAHLFDLFHRRLVRVPYVCRKLRKDIVPILSKNVTLQIATYKYISLIDDWRVTVHSDVKGFHSFLRSIPAAWAGRIDIVGVYKGVVDGEGMTVAKIRGYGKANLNHVDCKALLKGYVRQAYPEAGISFRDVKNASLL